MVSTCRALAAATNLACRCRKSFDMASYTAARDDSLQRSVNPIAIPVNVAAWIPLVVALISGLGILVTGMLLPFLTPLCAFSCHWSLAAMHGLIHLGQQVPGGFMRVAGWPDWWLIVFYVGLALMAAFPLVRPPIRWRCALLSAWVAVGFISSWATDTNVLRCTVLSVGHGEAVVLELPNGKTMLYDSGQISAPTAACRTISGYLWSRGITHIDAVVLSHSDIDHYNGLPGLPSRFSVGVVYVSGVMFIRDNAALHLLHDSIDAAGVPLVQVSSGDTLSGGPDCRIEILHPPSRGVIGTENANSVVLNVEYQGRRILMTGDLASLWHGRRHRRDANALATCSSSRITAAKPAIHRACRPGVRRAMQSSAPTIATIRVVSRQSTPAVGNRCTPRMLAP